MRKIWNRVRDWMEEKLIEWKYFGAEVESIFSKITKQVNKV